MMKRALIPYAGQPLRKSGKPFTAPGRYEPQLDYIGGVLLEGRVAEMFAAGNDTVAIAAALNCTPATAANALARARDRERAA